MLTNYQKKEIIEDEIGKLEKEIFTTEINYQVHSSYCSKREVKDEKDIELLGHFEGYLLFLREKLNVYYGILNSINVVDYQERKEIMEEYKNFPKNIEVNEEEDFENIL